MNILIMGGSGFIGTQLSKHLQELGHHVFVGTRSPEKLNAAYPTIAWPLDETQDYSQIEAVINLAGETINQRWNRSAKERIIQSRVETTRLLVHYISEGILKPKSVINGSAIGYYGTSTQDALTEEAAAGDDFLAHVTKAWEREADQLLKLGIRLVKARIGVVLGKEGGALPKMLLPYKLYAGGRLGSGKQWVSWIHLDDLVRLFSFCLSQEELIGAVNCTAPHPVQMEQLGRTIAKLLKKPHWLPAPSFAIRLLLGEMADLILKGQQVIPQRALEAGFNFHYPKLEDALGEVLTNS